MLRNGAVPVLGLDGPTRDAGFGAWVFALPCWLRGMFPKISGSSRKYSPTQATTPAMKYEGTLTTNRYAVTGERGCNHNIYSYPPQRAYAYLSFWRIMLLGSDDCVGALRSIHDYAGCSMPRTASPLSCVSRPPSAPRTRCSCPTHQASITPPKARAPFYSHSLYTHYCVKQTQHAS